METTAIPGLDLSRFRKYLDVASPGTVMGPLQARILPGGRSNLTYEVTDGASDWIVRRQPLGHILATSHDMAQHQGL